MILPIQTETARSWIPTTFKPAESQDRSARISSIATLHNRGLKKIKKWSRFTSFLQKTNSSLFDKLNAWYFKYQGILGTFASIKEHGLSTGSFWKKLEDGQRPGSAARAHMCGPGVFAVILLITGRVISDIANFRARSVTIVTCMYNYSKYWATLPLHWLKSAYN